MHPLRNCRYFLDCLKQSRVIADGMDVLYNDCSANMVDELASAVPAIVADLNEFYAASQQPRISIFVYPDLAEMSRAFGRELKSDQWCFVPLTGEHALVTFTAKLQSGTLAHVLTHEFSHVYFARVTGNVDMGHYRQSIPLWLDEGVALCLDRPYRNGFAQTLAARLQTLKTAASGYFPKLMEMYTYFNRLDEDEFGAKSALAYAFSYVCVSELFETFGRAHVARFLHCPGLANQFDALFEEHFSFSLPAFNAAMTETYGPISTN